MLVYRLTNKKYASDISGTGAAITGGRWNKKGRSVLCTSESIPLSLLEIVVNIPPIFQPDLMLFMLEIPESAIIEIPMASLPENWFQYPAPGILAEIGEEYYTLKNALILKVPSSVVPSSFNYILNCQHHGFSEIKIVSQRPFIFDPRLYRNPT